MIDLRAAVRSILLADPAISTMVGGTRIYPTVLPQGVTAPSVVQNLITENIDYHNAGDNRLLMARTQLDCWALSADQSVQLAGLVFDRLTGFKNESYAFGTNSPQNRIAIKGVFLDQGRDDYDDPSKMYTRRRDYLFWYWIR